MDLKEIKLKREEKHLNGFLESMSALVLSISIPCWALFNSAVMPVWGTQSTARWEYVCHSNKPFHMLGLKIAQELTKIKTNHFISIHYFLFFNLFQILPYWTKQHNLKFIIWDSKLFMQNIIPWKYLQLPPNLLFILPQRATKPEGSDESKLLKREQYTTWHPIVCAELGIHRGGEKYTQPQHVFPSDDI